MPKTYSLTHTNIAKGFFILLMIFHHVFAIQMNYWINFATPHTQHFNTLLMEVADYGQVCVGGFCFLSAYGITAKLKANSTLKYKNILISRLIKLYFNFWPIYVLGLIGTLLFANSSILEIYSSPKTGQFSFVLPLIDALGFSNALSLGTLNRTWWYIAAAVAIIFFSPLFYKLFVRFGYLFAILVCILPYIFGTNTYSILVTISMLGIIFAQNDIFSVLKTFIFNHKYAKITAYILTPMTLILSSVLATKTSIVIAMPLLTVACILFCHIILSDIPIIRKILECLGKHSANIFYIHSFIYLYWFTYTIYSLGSKLVIYCVVLTSSLLISFVIEFFKKLVRYNKAEQFVITHLTKSNY